MTDEPSAASRDGSTRVGLGELAGAFLKIALASFGGGLSAWSRRVVVEERRWLDDRQFLSAVTLTRLLPGANQINLAIYVGARARGVSGALAAVAGLVVVPLAILIGLGSAYARMSHLPAVESILTGAVAAATGMALSMAVKLGLPFGRDPVALLIAAAAFVGVDVLHIRLPWVVLALAPLSIAWFWPRESTAAKSSEPAS
jgi:chromate transporter